MKQTLLVGADEEVKQFCKTYAKALDKIFKLISDDLYEEYQRVEKLLLEDPALAQNWELSQAHRRGQQYQLRKTIEKLNESYFKHD